MEIMLRDRPIDGPDGRRLMSAYVADISARYPGWTPTIGPSAEPHELIAPHGRFVVAYADERPAGCGAVKRLDCTSAEIKRLYVAPETRGAGMSRLILARLEEVALEGGHAVARLDTGNRQPEALALFRSAGYHEIPDYNGNTFASYWFEKALAGAESANRAG
jgi:GNAT superfamily N-acetyltransferase